MCSVGCILPNTLNNWVGNRLSSLLMKNKRLTRLDESLLTEVNEIRVIKTSTREPLRLYSRLTSKSSRAGIPQAEVNTSTLFGKMPPIFEGIFSSLMREEGGCLLPQKQQVKLLLQKKFSSSSQQDHHIPPI